MPKCWGGQVLNDQDYAKIFEYEINGYPSSENGISPEVWRLAVIAKRIFKKKEEETGVEKEYATIQSINQIEEELVAARARCEKLPLPEPSLPSGMRYSMMQWQLLPSYAAYGRMRELAEQLARRKSILHDYASRKYYELKNSD